MVGGTAMQMVPPCPHRARGTPTLNPIIFVSLGFLRVDVIRANVKSNSSFQKFKSCLSTQSPAPMQARAGDRSPGIV